MPRSRRRHAKMPLRLLQVRGLVGPLMIITVGVIFLIAEYSRYSFFDLWPVLLIILGVLLVAQLWRPNKVTSVREDRVTNGPLRRSFIFPGLLHPAGRTFSACALQSRLSAVARRSGGFRRCS